MYHVTGCYESRIHTLQTMFLKSEALIKHRQKKDCNQHGWITNVVMDKTGCVVEVGKLVAVALSDTIIDFYKNGKG